MLLDKAKNKILCNEGIVVLDTMSPEDLKKFEKIVDELKPKYLPYSDRFFIDIFLDDEIHKKSLGLKLSKLMMPYLNRNLDFFKNTGFTIIQKGLGENSYMVPHQDDTTTDETQYESYNIWVSLSDNNSYNGGLHCIPESHKIFKNIRTPSLPWTYGNCADTLISLMKCIKVRKGTILIFNSRLIHYSPINQSKENRYSIIANVFPGNAVFYKYHYNSDFKELYKYEMGLTEIFEYTNYVNDKLKPLKGNIVEKNSYEPLIFDSNDLKKHIIKSNISLMRKIEYYIKVILNENK